MAVTEQEWLGCIDPQAMLVFLQVAKASDRKLRLFAVACCRRIWHLLIDKRSREAVEVAERYAEGGATDEELETASVAADTVWEVDRKRAAKEGKWDRRSRLPYYGSSAAAYNVAIPLGWWGAAPAFVAPDEIARETVPDSGAEGAAQCVLVWDIFGNPFRPVALDPALLTWNDTLVVRLAQAAYEERHLPAGTLDSSRLAVLADALEEAGCANADVLGHLRGPGPHVRGCWPVDLCLGKS
jgi:hypothetical protein